MHQFRKPTLWHLIICYFHSSVMICRRVIQAESSSSNPDLGRFSPDYLRSGNHRKSLEVLAFNLHVKAHVKTSNKSTARGTSARHFLGICGSCWFQQDSATVHTTIRARSWLKIRFGGKVISPLTSTRGRPWVRTCPPGHGSGAWLWQSSKQDPPPPRWLSWNKRSSPSPSQWTKKKSNRRYRVSADELAPAWSVTVPRLREYSNGPGSVVLCRPLTVICVLKLKQ